MQTRVLTVVPADMHEVLPEKLLEAAKITCLDEEIGWNVDEGADYSKLARWDLELKYELAFSPYLILQGKWGYTRFEDVCAGLEEEVSYYTLTIAQDLSAVKKYLAILNLLQGINNDTQGKHFIFYRIGNGQTPPQFEDLNEYSIGFGMYF